MALAGQWTSPYLWGFAVGFSAVFMYATIFVLDDGLARERFQPPSNGADAVALRWIRLSALAGVLLAPLDSGRLHWSAEVPAAMRILGIAGFVVGFWLVVDAMKANHFFSPVIRIQDERGHRVVDQGPYAVIRHPGYLGMLIVSPMAVLALGSWWALIPAGLYWMLIQVLCDCPLVSKIRMIWWKILSRRWIRPRFCTATPWCRRRRAGHL